ncbi:uncharacterized protein Dvir_GJ26374 [Drosophila virilis]|uniref:Uncharacterized protein n=1 Tax=Drosophila virilis TaxID=7244 RepID=A0A0Q9WWE6_DROVI|nr:uncharacterized protein LOC26531144 [Drosophila virilis]KRF85179.1 uncharacterized protein Dvir_GJ26374 [Drosophila virilis]
MKVPFAILLLVIVTNFFIVEGHRNKVKNHNLPDDHQQHHPSRHHGHNLRAQRKKHLFKRRNAATQNNDAMQNVEHRALPLAIHIGLVLVPILINLFTPPSRPPPRPPPPRPPPPRPTTRPTTTKPTLPTKSTTEYDSNADWYPDYTKESDSSSESYSTEDAQPFGRKK